MAISEQKDIFDPDGRLLDRYTLVYFNKGDDNRHFCRKSDELSTICHGIAVDSCESDQDGKLWVVTDIQEYGNEVLFCPFCGIQSTAIKD